MFVKLWIHKQPSLAEDIRHGFTIAFQFEDGSGLIDEFEATYENTNDPMNDLSRFINELNEVLLTWKKKKPKP